VVWPEAIAKAEVTAATPYNDASPFMTINFDNFRGDRPLQRSTSRPDAAEFAPLHAGKSILVTGAGGSIGSALAQALFDLGPHSLVLLDSSEQNLFHIYSQLLELPGAEKLVPVLGSVAAESCVCNVFERHQPEIVYHAAALKHVPLMEMNPFAVIQNNVLGTFTLATIAKRFAAGRLAMISTDKAVNPRSIVGASKRLAELALLAFGGQATCMTSIRLGNVLGSEGSVVPLFIEQIKRGGPVTVTDPNVERYFMTMDETVRCTLRAATSDHAGSGICVPPMGEPIKISDLAQYMIERAAAAGVSIQYTGLRPGDKLHEEFVSDREVMSPDPVDGLHRVESPHFSEPELTNGIAELNAAVEQRSLASLLATLTRLLPEYQPSAYLLEQVAMAAAT